nr:hypothetical protein GCM10020185_10290 [Pseudomonas brassicacearum subsp. brassicacearum]
MAQLNLKQLLIGALVMSAAFTAQAERLKDIASISGVRSNQLIGYGLVVGLNGTGDQTTQTPFTLQTFNNMLSQFGIKVPAGSGNVQLKKTSRRCRSVPICRRSPSLASRWISPSRPSVTPRACAVAPCC